jgi:phosphoglycolate phosphatase
MKHYTVALFDLDGTIIDPIIGIVNSVKYALDCMKIDYNPTDSFEKFIGPPLDQSFQNFYSLSESGAREAVEFYRVYYKKSGMKENHLYTGIKDLIQDMAKQNILLFVATSKPTLFAIDILKYYQLADYFKEIVGANMDLTRTAKNEIIGYILSKNLNIDPNNCVMIGDRSYDIIGAQENQLDSIGVLYGYGSNEEMKEVKPTYMAETVDDLRKILL